MAEVETPAPKKRGRPKGKTTNKELRDGETERRVSSRSSDSTRASPYVQDDLRRKSVRIEKMDVEPLYPAANANDAATRAAREKTKSKSKTEARRQLDKERQATAMEDEQLLYETLAKEVDNTLDDGRSGVSMSARRPRRSLLRSWRSTTTSARTTFGWTASSRPAPLGTSASSRRSAIRNCKARSRCAGPVSSTIARATRTTRYLGCRMPSQARSVRTTSRSTWCRSGFGRAGIT